MTVVRSGARAAYPEDVFRGMFSSHYGAVHAYCARRLGSADAADATEDVFVVAWRRIRRVPSEPDTLPWLYGVARNVVRNHRRRRNREQRLAAKAGSLTAVASGFEHPDSIEPVIAALRDDDREILMLAAWEGLAPSEIAEVLGCSANTATVRLHRARRRLSAAWDDIHGGAR